MDARGGVGFLGRWLACPPLGSLGSYEAVRHESSWTSNF